MLIQLKKIKVIRKIKTVWFKIITNSLPTLSNCHYKDKTEADALCKLCNKKESFQHLFEECILAKKINQCQIFSEIKDTPWHKWENNSLKLNFIRTFMIWKIRCDTVIGKKKRSEKSIEKEIEEIILRHKIANLW